MYSINLYREGVAVRREAGWRPIRAALLTIFLVVELLLVVSLALSAVLLGEQKVQIEAEIDRIQKTVAREFPADAGAETAVARESLTLRLSRIDWSTKLAALSKTIDPGLRVTSINAQSAQGDRPARMLIDGLVSSSAADMETVSRFIQQLREDPGFSAGISNIRLGKVETRDRSRFRIICEIGTGVTQ